MDDILGAKFPVFSATPPPISSGPALTEGNLTHAGLCAPAARAACRAPPSHPGESGSEMGLLPSSASSLAAARGAGVVAARSASSTGDLALDFGAMAHPDAGDDLASESFCSPAQPKPAVAKGTVAAQKAPPGLASTPASARKQKTSANEDLVESAKELLARCDATLSLEHLWDRMVRARDFENTLNKLSAKASKLAQVVAMSEDLFRYATLLEERRAIFMHLWNEPEALSGCDLPNRQKLLLQRLPVNLKSNVLVAVAFNLMSKVDKGCWLGALRVAHYCQGSNQLAVPLIGDTQDPMAMKAIVQVQSNIVLAFCDKVVKKMPMSEFVAAMCALAEANLVPTAIEYDRLDPGVACIGPSGWTDNCLADLGVLIFFGAFQTAGTAAVLRIGISGCRPSPS